MDLRNELLNLLKKKTEEEKAYYEARRDEQFADKVLEQKTRNTIQKQRDIIDKIKLDEEHQSFEEKQFIKRISDLADGVISRLENKIEKGEKIIVRDIKTPFTNIKKALENRPYLSDFLKDDFKGYIKRLQEARKKMPVHGDKVTSVLTGLKDLLSTAISLDDKPTPTPAPAPAPAPGPPPGPAKTLSEAHQYIIDNYYNDIMEPGKINESKQKKIDKLIKDDPLMDPKVKELLEKFKSVMFKGNTRKNIEAFFQGLNPTSTTTPKKKSTTTPKKVRSKKKSKTPAPATKTLSSASATIPEWQQKANNFMKTNIENLTGPKLSKGTALQDQIDLIGRSTVSQQEKEYITLSLNNAIDLVNDGKTNMEILNELNLITGSGHGLILENIDNIDDLIDWYDNEVMKICYNHKGGSKFLSDMRDGYQMVTKPASKLISNVPVIGSTVSTGLDLINSVLDIF